MPEKVNGVRTLLYGLTENTACTVPDMAALGLRGIPREDGPSLGKIRSEVERAPFPRTWPISSYLNLPTEKISPGSPETQSLDEEFAPEGSHYVI